MLFEISRETEPKLAQARTKLALTPSSHNLTDQVTSGELCFSDGTREPFGELTNYATEGIELEFPSRKTDSLQMNITGVKEGTLNSGISEIIVFEEDEKEK